MQVKHAKVIETSPNVCVKIPNGPEQSAHHKVLKVIVTLPHKKR